MLSSEKNTPSADPFTGIKVLEPSKKLDVRLKIADGEALSPQAGRRTQLSISQQMSAGRE